MSMRPPGRPGGPSRQCQPAFRGTASPSNVIPFRRTDRGTAGVSRHLSSHLGHHFRQIPISHSGLALFVLGSLGLAGLIDSLPQIASLPQMATLALCLTGLATLYHHLFLRVFLRLHLLIATTLVGALFLDALAPLAVVFAAVVITNVALQLVGWLQ